MSGHRVPYHLRANKFVERQLFMDILGFVRVWNGPCPYAYASMGGQFLEDFKAVHDRFGIEQLVSIEMNKVTWERQKFNVPLGFIDCLNLKSGEFIEQYSTILAREKDCRAIVWLDFAEANARGKQLQEYESLVEMLIPGDVVKITLNANPESKCQRRDFDTDEKYESAAIKALTAELTPDYEPLDEITADDLKRKDFASLLARCIKTAAHRGLSDVDDYSIVPLGSYRYSDSKHQMLTVTAIVVDDALSEVLNGDLTFNDWPMRSSTWDEVHNVRVPDLSQKERAYVNQFIGSKNTEEIHELMPFRLEKRKSVSIDLLENYVMHHRRYPAFGRIFM